ncbi:hypothetical protein [Paenibacillus sp. BIC5C1]|uniref:hypothetical protein n=1 Tax=Paenibacillus sp. BIC5C1 TaxID=3078263 RepID=UPI0028E83598|nr:hypothetical protein [Paenibacillus sp. BIC5C1]
MTLEQWIRNRYYIIEMPLGAEMFEFIVWGNKLGQTNIGIFTKLDFFLSAYDEHIDMNKTDEEILKQLIELYPENQYGYNELIV